MQTTLKNRSANLASASLSLCQGDGRCLLVLPEASRRKRNARNMRMHVTSAGRTPATFLARVEQREICAGQCDERIHERFESREACLIHHGIDAAGSFVAIDSPFPETLVGRCAGPSEDEVLQGVVPPLHEFLHNCEQLCLDHLELRHRAQLQNASSRTASSGNASSTPTVRVPTVASPGVVSGKVRKIL